MGSGVATARDDVLALRVEQVFAVQRPLAGRGIAAEGHAGARVLAQVAEHHRHHVDRGAHAVGDVVQLPVVDRAARVPALEDRRDGAPELVERVAGEVAPALLAHVRLEASDHRLHLLDREVDVPLDAAAVPVLLEDLLEALAGQVEDYAAVHLHEPAVRVPGELRIAALPGQPLDRDVVEPEVEDRLHHPGHRHRGARAHAHQERVVAVAEVLAGRGLHPVERVLDLHLQAAGEVMAFEVAEAETAGDGEAGRDGDADGGHLGEAGALAAEDVLHAGGAVRAPLPEEVDEGLGVGAAHAGVATSGEA